MSQQVISDDSGDPQHLNALINANSPYLLSHALQPIDWLEWRSDFNLGSGNDKKLLFISIGYSTCHWCHVMAQESFSDEVIANILNKSYVSVKVDREQWPLVDNRFKSALEAMKGDAGWPINAILTPDGQLVWIDSYVNKQEFNKVLKGLAIRWQSKPSSVIALANRIEEKLLLDKPPVLLSKSINLSRKEWQQWLLQIHNDISTGLAKQQVANGPRFLRAYWAIGLLDDYLRTDNSLFLNQVKLHVDKILASPTYDAVDGGFHRYAVDSNWQVPHYEKMLYTQANMMRVLARLYAVTGNIKYDRAIIQTAKWTEQRLGQLNGIGSAMSAMSENVEGLYYQMTPSQLLSIDLSKDWPNSQAVQEMVKQRQDRIPPPIDEKVILSWNSLYIVALLEAYQVTRHIQLLNSAKLISQQLWNNLVKGDLVYRSAFANNVAIDAEIEDLAWFATSQYMLSFYENWSKVDSNTSDNRISPLSRAEFLLNKVKIRLSDLNELNTVLNLNRDGELPSARSATFSALILGYELGYNRQYQHYATAVSSIGLNSHSQLINEYSYVIQQAKITENVQVNQARFARGNGKVTAKIIGNQINLYFSLRKNWHINAHKLTNNKFIATNVIVDLEESKVIFPEPVKKLLGFDDSYLALLEGDFIVSIVDVEENLKSVNLQLTLQACSDSLCLLPEVISIFVNSQPQT
ncbi:thioredoxin domain-containing protein [Shewanella donghaensis]|uniref:thioredoxin domain-containing protein n=1 Tax=Shewanella donghaensis TaxID=238836 RepID=UPI001315940F|nr:DUF255 domain-containing protein [Shewanella donghaensis]